MASPKSNVLKIRPSFWRDQLWFTPGLTLVIWGTMMILMVHWSKGGPEALGLVLLMSLLILPPLILVAAGNLTSAIIFEKDRVIFRILFSKTVIDRTSFEGCYGNEAGWPILFYQDARRRRKQHPVFTWPHSLLLVMAKLKERWPEINYDPEALAKVARRNTAGKVWFLVIMIITCVGLLVGLWNMSRTPHSAAFHSVPRINLS